ncbi:MAG: DUF1929 domain-containing protein [Proteobacteria bacterium]|nr:DUF1929 domain-containing protein [Pseudomonadota bacterium]
MRYSWLAVGYSLIFLSSQGLAWDQAYSPSPKKALEPLDFSDLSRPIISTFGNRALPKNQQFIVDTMVEHFAKERAEPESGSTQIPMAKNQGKWSKLFHTPNMQAIHSVLLPSGKLLIVNGSSHRERGGTTADVFRDFDELNNMALVDLEEGKESFTPLELPKESLMTIRDSDSASAIDLFCSGHHQLPNGDVLFVGGSREYDLGNFSFSGSKIAWIFDSQKGQFSKFMQTKEGRWYPSLFELGDGRIAIVSGIGDQAKEYGPVPDYPLDVSYSVEVYDSYNNSWSSFSLESRPVTGTASGLFPGVIGGSWDTYPRAALMSDGRLLFTGDGVYPGSRFNKNIFSLKFSPYNKPLNIAIEGYANQRVSATGKFTSADYPGLALDPNSPDSMMTFGGQLGMNNLSEPVDTDTEIKRVTADISRITYKDGEVSTQHFEKAYGDRQSPSNAFRNLDGTMNNFAVVLPTGEILVLGGGNYGFRAPVFHPVLLTPDVSEPLGYKPARMSPFWLPHLYHTTALLLPDGRVMLAGGNVHRALALPKTKTDSVPNSDEFAAGINTRVALNPYDEPGTNYSLRPRTTLGTEKLEDQVMPTEFHFIEIFEPPYLSTGKPRPTIDSIATHKMSYEASFDLNVKSSASDTPETAKVHLLKIGSATHGMDFAQRLVKLPIKSLSHGHVEVSTPQQPTYP